MPREMKRIQVITVNEYLESSSKTMSLDLAPKFTLFTPDTIHDVVGNVSKMFTELVLIHNRSILEQVALIQVPLERFDRFE